MMSLYIVGAYSTSGLEGHIFDKMPNRRDGEPEWPDYQLLFIHTSSRKLHLNSSIKLVSISALKNSN
jgi:hypothetical protein